MNMKYKYWSGQKVNTFKSCIDTHTGSYISSWRYSCIIYRLEIETLREPIKAFKNTICIISNFISVSMLEDTSISLDMLLLSFSISISLSSSLSSSVPLPCVTVTLLVTLLLFLFYYLYYLYLTYPYLT